MSQPEQRPLLAADHDSNPISTSADLHPLPRIMRMLSPCISEYITGDCSISGSNNSTSGAFFLFARLSLSSISKEMNSTIQHEMMMYEKKSKRRWKTVKDEIESQLQQLAEKRAIVTAAEQISLDQQLYRLFYDPSEEPPPIPSKPTYKQNVDLAPLDYFTPRILARMTTLISQGAQLHCHSSICAHSNHRGDHLASMLKLMIYSREYEACQRPRGRTVSHACTTRDGLEMMEEEEGIIHIPTCFLIMQQCLLSNPSALLAVCLQQSTRSSECGSTLIQLICGLSIKQQTHQGTTLIEYQAEFQQFAEWCLALLECVPPLNLPSLTTISDPLTSFLTGVDTVYSNRSLLERWCWHEVLEFMNRSPYNKIEQTEGLDAMQWSMVARLLGEKERSSTASSSPTISCRCTFCTIVTATNRILGTSTLSSSSTTRASSPMPSPPAEEMKIDQPTPQLENEVKESLVDSSATPVPVLTEMSEEEKEEAKATAERNARHQAFAIADLAHQRQRFIARCVTELTSITFLPPRILTLLFPVTSSDDVTTTPDSLPSGVTRLLSIYTECLKSPSFSWSCTHGMFPLPLEELHVELDLMEQMFSSAYDNCVAMEISSLRKLLSQHICCDGRKKRALGQALKSREFRELCQTIAKVEEIGQKMKDNPPPSEFTPSMEHRQREALALQQCPFRDPPQSSVSYPYFHSSHPLTIKDSAYGLHECTQCRRYSYFDQTQWVDEHFYVCKESKPSEDKWRAAKVCGYISSHASDHEQYGWAPKFDDPIDWEVCSRCVEGHVRTQLQQQYQLAQKDKKIDLTLHSIHYRPELHNHTLNCCEVNDKVTCHYCARSIEAESQSSFQYRCRFVDCVYTICQRCLIASYSKGQTVTSSAVTYASPSKRPFFSSSSSSPPTLSTSSTPTPTSLSSLIRDSFAVRTFISGFYFEFLRRKELKFVKMMHQLIQPHFHASQLKFIDSTTIKHSHSGIHSRNMKNITENAGKSPLMYLCSRVHGLRLNLFDFLLVDATTNGNINAILSETDRKGATLYSVLQKPANRKLLEHLVRAYPGAVVELGRPQEEKAGPHAKC